MIHTVWALLEKDARIHWQHMFGLWIGLGVFVRALLWLLPPPEEVGVLPPVLVPMVVYIHLGSAAWLVDRERSRRTFALLRAMPVSDASIVTSKLVAHALVNLVGFGSMLVVYPRALTLVTPATLVTTAVTSITFGSYVVGMRLLLPDRPGTILPLLLLLAVAAAGWRLSQQYDMVASFVLLSSRWWFQYALWGGALATNCAIWLITVRLFEARDTSALTS